MSPARSILAVASSRPKSDSRPGASMVTMWEGKSTPTLTPPRKAKESPRRSSDASRNSASAASWPPTRLKVPQAGDLTGHGILISRNTGSRKTGATRPSTRPGRKDRLRLSAGRPGFWMSELETSSALRSELEAAPDGPHGHVVDGQRVRGHARRERTDGRPCARAGPRRSPGPLQTKGMRRTSSRMSVSRSKRASSSIAGSKRFRTRPPAVSARPGPVDRQAGSTVTSSPLPERSTFRAPIGVRPRCGAT